MVKGLVLYGLIVHEGHAGVFVAVVHSGIAASECARLVVQTVVQAARVYVSAGPAVWGSGFRV